MTSALVITVSAQSVGHALALAHAVADHLAAAELHLLAVDREIALDLDDELGVGEPHAVADRRPEHLGVGAAVDLHRLPFASRWRRVAFGRASRGSSRRCVERPHHLAGEAVDDALARQRDQLDRARLARLEAHRGAGRDVEPEAARRGAIEGQRRVGLEEVVVRADLDRPVAGVGDRQRDRRAARRSARARRRRTNEFAGDHGIGWCTVTSFVPSGNVASTWISGIISGTPSITCARVEQRRAVAHQLGDGPAVARAFHDRGARCRRPPPDS